MSTLKVDTITGKTTSGTVAMPAGMVVQTKTGTLNRLTTSSATMASLGSLSITPKFSTSLILISIQNHYFHTNLSDDYWRGALIEIKRDSTSLETDGGGFGEANIFEGNSEQAMGYSTRFIYDTPSTTNSVSYEFFGASISGRVAVDFNNTSFGAGGKIHIMEIKQ